MHFTLLQVHTLFAEVPNWLKAGFWGLFSGSALLAGAAIGYFVKIPQRIIAVIMSFGSGVLVSALSFELMDEAYKRGGFYSTSVGFVSGGLIYSIANVLLNKKGAKHRKRSDERQISEKENPGSGIAIAIGALLDGIPEAIAIGISMIEGGAVSMATVIAIFISNFPEGLSSSSGMRKSGRSKAFVFGLWAIITLITGLGAVCGYTIFSGFAPEVIAAVLAVAAGAILSMVADTMIPEAYEENHNWIGLITVIGFLCAFALTKLE